MNTCIHRRIRAMPCILVLLTATCAAAAPRDQPEPDYVNSMRLSNTERPAADSVRARFRQIDADHNGRIDRSEAQASRELAARFDALDADHDGVLTLREFAAIHDIAAIRIDRDDDRR